VVRLSFISFPFLMSGLYLQRATVSAAPHFRLEFLRLSGFWWLSSIGISFALLTASTQAQTGFAGFTAWPVDMDSLSSALEFG
jgi:hypothetical protein